MVWSQLAIVSLFYHRAKTLLNSSESSVSEEDVDFMLDLNVRSLMQLTQVFVRQFKKQGSGHIINLGSVAGELLI